jgi:CsoR family transcriptional regulator, copper-sensing transcriptional repressor
MKPADHAPHLRRLKRIEGQVRGVARMVEDRRYCVDILAQMRAVRAALKRTEERILREHVDHCVVQAVRAGRPEDRRQKLEELFDVVERFSV